ncbi:MAG: PEP-CTERM sorting domain-containing protein [Rubrivivax sp.]|nr:MAG: PEP-CTERM sorting domain-containing protein [Rubrivivax sp.]
MTLNKPFTPTHAALGALLALTLSTQASAAVITFDGLTGATADPLSAYTEDGFTVTPTLGAWKEAHVFGNPLPSIYVSALGPDTPFGNLSVTAGGSLFTFNSLDLQAFNSAVGYEIRGSRGGTVLFSSANGQAASPDFKTLTAGGGLAIDTLTFDISGGPGSFNVDNINLTAVPEPSAYLLLFSGLSALGLMRRRARLI